MEHTDQRSSLERLKALDNIPDLPSQLEEARKLCTERNRADMIARWTLRKLKSDSSHGSEPWKLLLTCIRVQNSPERVGNAISSSNILGIIEATLNRHEASVELLSTLVEVLQVLLHKSTAAHGTYIKAALSAPATSAASFLGAWLRYAHRVSAEEVFTESRSLAESLILPATTIWEWRKSAADENQCFAQHCLVPASLLLCSDVIGKNTQNLKRKSGATLVNNHGDKQTLEKLLAQNIFAPSRAAFWKAIDKPAPEIRTLLQPLIEDSRATQVLPSLLDIALRTSSMSTMRQRTKEGPWVDEVFQALLACNCDQNGDIFDMRILTQLLATARLHTSLSNATLQALWERHFALGKSEPLLTIHVEQDPMSIDSIGRGAANPDNPAIPSSWEFVAELVKSSGDIFDERVTRTLFATIVGYPIHIPSGTAPAWFEEFDRFAEQRIVVPIMKAFAKRREIGTFMEIWSHSPELSGISDALAELVEESMTEQAFVDRMEQARGQIEQLASTDGTDTNPTSIFMVANALLAGIRNPKWLDAIHEMLGELLDVLLDFAETSSADVEILAEPTRSTQECVWQEQYWILLTRIFETWSPSWIGSQRDDAQRNEERTLLLKSTAVAAALQLVGLVSDESPRQKPWLATATAAGRFLASMCSTLHGNKSDDDSSCAKLCVTTATQLLRSCGPASIDLVAQHPGLFFMVDGDLRRRCLADGLEAVTGAASSGGERVREDSVRLMAIQSIANTAAEKGEIAIIDDLVGILIFLLGPSVAISSVEKSRLGQEVALILLSGLPPQSFNRTQRERIIDVIYKRQTAAMGAESSPTALVNLRLAVMTKLMELSNATCILSTNPTQLWTLAQSAMSAPDSQHTEPAAEKVSVAYQATVGSDIDDQAEHLATPKLLQELVKLVIGHLLATKDQDRSRAALIALAGSVGTSIECIRTVADTERAAWKLLVIKTMVLRLEAGAGEGLKDQFAYRDQNLLEGFFKTLLEHVFAGVNHPDSVVNSSQPRSVQFALGTLSDWPPHLIPAFVRRSVQARRYEILEQLLVSYDNPPASTTNRDKTSWLSQDTSGRVAALILWFSVGCKCGSKDEGSEFGFLAHRILELRLTPTQRCMLVESFELLVGRVEPDEVTKLMRRLYPQVSDVHRHGRNAAPQLIEICLSKLNEASSSKEQLSDLRVVMGMLRTNLTASTDRFVSQAAGECLVTILKRTPFAADQYIIEETLLGMLTVLKKPNVPASLFLEVCNIMATLLLQYRSRLRSRYHLVVKMFQGMMAALFSGLEHHRYAKDMDPTLACARRLARLIVLFCEPPQTRKASSNTALVDEARKEQANVGQHVQTLLHSYCRQVLATTAVEGLRDALTPAVWSIIEAMEINDADGIKSLSAAMNNSERAVLRGIYGDWRRVGKWRGG